MPHTNYLYQMRDIKFQMKEWLDMDKLMSMPAYADMFEADDLDSFLDLNYSICKDQICPANGDADEIGWKYDSSNIEHAVSQTEAMQNAFHSVVDNGLGMQFGNRDTECKYADMKMPLAWFAPILEMQSAASAGLVMNWCITQGATTIIQFEAAEKFQALYLPKMYAGEWGGTMCLTEPGAGSEVGNCATKCFPTDTPGLWKVKGNKIFITSGDSDIFTNIVHMVLAKAPNALPGTKGISLLMVPKFWVEDDGTISRWNDVTTVGIEHKMGIHGSVTCSLAFGENDNCYGWMVGPDPGPDGKGDGIRQMFRMMNEERLNTGEFALGVIGAAYYAALEHARIRVQGRSVKAAKDDFTQVRIIEHPDVRRMLMFQKSLLEACRAIMYSTYYKLDLSHESEDPAEAKAADRFFQIMVPMCKAYVSDMGWRVTEQCIQVHGGYGFIEEYPGAQLARDIKIHSLWEGTNFMHGQDLTGRKFTMDGGEPFKAWWGEITDFVATKKIDELAPAWDMMEKLVAAFQRILDKDAEWKAAKTKEMTDLFATHILHAAASIYGAKCLLDQAIIAAAKLKEVGADTADGKFYASKMATATFFTMNVAPDEVFGAEAMVLAADRTAFDMDEALFDC